MSIQDNQPPSTSPRGTTTYTQPHNRDATWLRVARAIAAFRQIGYESLCRKAAEQAARAAGTDQDKSESVEDSTEVVA